MTTARRLRLRVRSLRSRHRESESSLLFGMRLALAVAATFLLVGVAGYLMLEDSLAHRTISDLANAQRADAGSFDGYGAISANPIAEINQVLVTVGRRPGTLEVKLIDPNHVIVASEDNRQLGTHDSNAPILAALTRGAYYAGRENVPGVDGRDFEFVAPVDLPTGRYAYEVTYDHRAYDAQLHEIRVMLALIGLLALLVGGGGFYLVGGRGLMRDHRRMLRRATRDGLTDLPNQRAFQDEFPQAVSAAVRYQHPLALAVLDADDFKLINDRHGHPHGDAVLGRIAAVLRAGRPSDRPYRIGGDEFALLLGHTDAEGASRLAQRLHRDLETAGVEASIGVSTLHPGLSADSLRAEADAALYEAKRLGGNRVAHFDDIRGRVAVTTSTSKDAVRRLIEEQDLSTVFQPIWDLSSGSLLGVEALSRPSARYGLSGPAEAFDVAEQIGRVHQLDVLCIEQALESVPALSAGVLLFLNLSPRTLDLDSEGDDWLLAAVERHGLKASDVVIEVTERFGGRVVSVLRCMRRLHDQGFRLAVDDVGTGNSGLEMLRGAQPEFVKIDRSIVVASATEPAARAVLMAMAAFARQTGAFVIAEGIGDEDTLEFLRSIEERHMTGDTVIQGGQGFELGRPSREVSCKAPVALRNALSERDREDVADATAAPLSAAASAARRRAGSSRR